MEALFQVLDLFTYGAAVFGGLLAVLWIYNSTLKEQRELIRRAGKKGDPTLRDILERGAFVQRLGFCAAAVATAAAVFWFARTYHAKYGVDVSPAYIAAAVILALVGVLGTALILWGRRKE